MAWTVVSPSQSSWFVTGWFTVSTGTTQGGWFGQAVAVVATGSGTWLVATTGGGTWTIVATATD